jgi:hypothetical protein
MACGNNMVSRSGLQSAPVSIAMPAGPGPARPQPSMLQIARVKEQTRAAMEQAERRAASATTAVAAKEVVRDAQRAVDAARRMRGSVDERARLVSELEHKLDAVKQRLSTAVDVGEHAIDRLHNTLLGVSAHLEDVGRVGARTLAAVGTAAEIAMATANFAHVAGNASQGYLSTADSFTSVSQQAVDQAEQLQENYADADVRWREQHQPGPAGPRTPDGNQFDNP